MKKNFLKIVMLLFIFLSLFGVNPEMISASTKTLGEGTVTLYPFGQYSDPDTIEFKMPKSGYVVMDFNVSLNNSMTYSSNERLQVVLKNSDTEKIIENDTFADLPSGISGDLGNYWDYSKKIKAGFYQYDLYNRGTHTVKVAYKITYYSDYASSIKLSSKSVTVTTDKYKLVKYSRTPSDSRTIITNIEVSNPKVAAVYYYGNTQLEVDGLKAGKCKVTITLLNGKKTSFNVTVKNPSKPALRYKTITMCKGETIQNKLKYTSSKVKWTSSKKSIATVSSSGKITAKGVGKCTITAKVGSTKYKCTVQVVYQDPDFFAVLEEYNTRDNYFTVKFKNNSNKTMKISSGLRVEHVKYTSYDRNLHLNKTVSIKPGKTATVKFYVKGGVTWYQAKRYTLMYKFVFDGKTYQGNVWTTDSVFSKNSSWYYTYRDQELYLNWWQC